MRASSAARTLRETAPVFAALGDETRLRLVARLCDDGPQSIAKLTERSDVTRQAVTKHLRVLEDAGVVRGSREGRESVWEIEPRRLEAARRSLDLISARWDSAIERLRLVVEREE
ncbi:MAG TPA: metalloregulator ArsR/SmtB family transcription factor [Polyangiaceae bacterium]|nr:metalloregulator ArsR/SmtB family transcription factor [Polyangiaceae bacterium]